MVKLVQKESDLIKQIAQRLSVYEITGEVEWWMRINAGKVKTYYGSYILLAPSGTPDYIAVIRDKQKNLIILFIEAKSITGRLREHQELFAMRYNDKKNIYVKLIRQISELDTFINEHAYDFVKDLSL